LVKLKRYIRKTSKVLLAYSTVNPDTIDLKSLKTKMEEWMHILED